MAGRPALLLLLCVCLSFFLLRCIISLLMACPYGCKESREYTVNMFCLADLGTGFNGTSILG
jgi:hypothetical protein